MRITLSSEIFIEDPTPELTSWVRNNLIMANPEYEKKKRMGLYTGNVSQIIRLYRVDDQTLILPCGVARDIAGYIKGSEFIYDLTPKSIVKYPVNVPLYDYQEAAVKEAIKHGCGILQSPCGSGKTQMGIALASLLSRRTLWVTHTQDLLKQSYDRAATYFPKSMLGTITGGKVNIGSHMTFATVQTLSKLDLPKYKYVWDVIIVDECHRVSGSPTAVTMFYKVMNNLAASYKYGLSATVHRGDGLIKSTFACIGNVIYKVPESAVSDKTIAPTVERINTDIPLSNKCLDTDGTLDYMGMLEYITTDYSRAKVIADLLRKNQKHYNLVLSDRLEHLKLIKDILISDGISADDIATVNGKMTSKLLKAERVMAMDDMRNGKKHFLFASYSLAKEGLDIPRLDRLYLATPKKDYAVVTQSVGRVGRTFEGKQKAIVYDFVDNNIPFCDRMLSKRKTIYRKAGCKLWQ